MLSTEKNRAFTMVELVLVIVVAGILAAVAIPRWNRDTMPELLDQVAAHIRHTQQLAINDNKFDASNPQWYKELWRISFRNANKGNNVGWTYSVYFDIKNSAGSISDYDGDPNTLAQIATDPQNPQKLLTSGFANQAFNTDISKMNKKLNITKTYGVSNVGFSGCNRSNTISFDNYGRPYSQVSDTNNLYDRLIRGNGCTITFSINDRQGSINIAPETGYVSVNYNR